MRAITRRAIGLVAGAGTITAAITLAGMGAAQATAPMHGGGGDGKGHCDSAHVQYSVDGGHTWYGGPGKDNPFFGGDAPVTKFDVKLQWDQGKAPSKGCEYPVSLASYETEGPSWATSGTQTYVGMDTYTLTKEDRQKTLDVSGHAPQCFGQTDLYNGDVVYDGNLDANDGKQHGKVPNYKDGINTPENLITAWNGGHKCEGGTPTPTDTATTPTTTPSDTASATPTDTATTPTDTPSGTPSDTATTAPAPSSSDTATPVPTNPTPGRTGTTVVQPVSTTPTGNLAETGGNGSQNLAFAGGGAALLVVGGAAVYFTRRRRNGAHS